MRLVEPSVTTDAVDVASTRQQRIAAVVTVIAGAALIALTLRVERNSAPFYISGFGLALVWIVGARVSSRTRWRGISMSPQMSILVGLAVGVAAFGVFVVGALVGRHIAVLAGPIKDVLGRADAGPLAVIIALALVNAVAEEMFFRGALVHLLPRRAALVGSTLLYAFFSAVGGNTAVTLAAVVMGAVFGIVRLRTGGLLASVVTHASWSVLVILLLPR